MAIRCDDVRNLLALPPSDTRAEEIAEHLDQCGECDRQLSGRIGEALDRLPVGAGPSLFEVRRLARNRQSFFLKIAAAAAAVMVLIGTAWAVLRDPAPAPRVAERPAPIPDPPKLEELREIDRNLIRSEGVLALYLQFCLSCLNRPTDEDKGEFLIRAMLVFREVRGAMKARYEQVPMPDAATVTRDGLAAALRTMRSSPLPSVKLLPAKITGFKFESGDKWSVNHLLGSTPFRLTLGTLPAYLSFTYVQKALGADDALMGRIEDVLWTGEFVNLPKRLEDRDPTVSPQVLKAVLPLLSPRQQKIYRQIAGAP